MAATIRVTIEGAEELARKLVAIGADVEAVLGVALRAGATIIQQAASRQAPGPHIDIGDAERTWRGMEISIGPDKDHWYYRFAETGTAPHRIGKGNVLRMGGTGAEFFAMSAHHTGHEARPFLRPALDENTDTVRNTVGDEIKKVLPE